MAGGHRGAPADRRSDGRGAGALRARGVHALLLKGPAIARWLYEMRPSARTSTATCWLGQRISRPAERSAPIAGLHGASSTTCGCRRGGVNMPPCGIAPATGSDVDLHRTLIGVAVDDATAWRAPLGRYGGGRGRGTSGAGARPAGEGDARRIARRAARRRAGPLGLRIWSGLWPPGTMISGAGPRLWQRSCRPPPAFRHGPAAGAWRRTAHRPSGAARRPLGRGRAPQRPAAAAGARLRAAGASALGCARDYRSPGASSCHTPAFMRDWDPDAATGRVGLARAYVRRAPWLLRRAPAGLLAWYRARRSVRATGWR